MQDIFTGWPRPGRRRTEPRRRLFVACLPEGGRGRLTHADHKQRRDCRVKAVRGLFPAHPKGLALRRQSRRGNLVVMSKLGGGLVLPGVIWPGVWPVHAGAGPEGARKPAGPNARAVCLQVTGRSDELRARTPRRLARALPGAPRFCITRILFVGRERGTSDHPEGANKQNCALCNTVGEQGAGQPAWP
jgi:hypothetical protein